MYNECLKDQLSHIEAHFQLNFKCKSTYINVLFLSTNSRKRTLAKTICKECVHWFPHGTGGGGWKNLYKLLESRNFLIHHIFNSKRIRENLDVTAKVCHKEHGLTEYISKIN